MISGIIKVKVSVISQRLRLITLTETLIIPDITKTESNNCLLVLRCTRRCCIFYIQGDFNLSKPHWQWQQECCYANKQKDGCVHAL